ncbi:nuclear autoantigenic sperm protein isoform X3 [Gouania willdenowi]|uniref:nuclear autoantigenic sperm protein isoform X3 n=1 Tax=Gouania willdenowi TaxID=441366 RepID=UPI0010559A59|nr:histone-binding protein N1/N2-like isoform X3 [Gouania willdenowi]
MPEEASAPSSSGSAEEKPCSSSAGAAAESSSADVMEEAKKLIGTGKRHLVMGDVVSAVNVFQDACGMLAAKYGDTADECGEAAFLCGKSLLELARMENGVLGNALEGVPEESEEEDQPSNIESANDLDDETRDELRRQVYEALAETQKVEATCVKTEPEEATTTCNGHQESENAKSATSPVSDGETVSELNGNGSESPDAATAVNAAQSDCSTAVNAMEEGLPKNDESNDSQEEQDEDSSVEDEPQDDDEEDEGDDEGAEQSKEEEEVGNLQLAWEMLEVAKVIYKRKENQEDQLMAAQAYLKLGEVSAESGNYPQALEDFQECLALQLKHLPPHSRLLAETHYHIATALCYMDQYSQAIQHYSSSIKVIEHRMSVLQEAMASSEEDEAASKERKEVEELKQLLPDITEKMEDAKESQRTASAASHAIQQTLGGASTSSAFLCENGGPSSSAALPALSLSPVKTESTCETSSQPKAVSDISHLVRKKRKPEESPVKDTDAKQVKRETTVNGSDDSNAGSGKGVKEGKSQEPAAPST